MIGPKIMATNMGLQRLGLTLLKRFEAVFRVQPVLYGFLEGNHHFSSLLLLMSWRANDEEQKLENTRCLSCAMHVPCSEHKICHLVPRSKPQVLLNNGRLIFIWVWNHFCLMMSLLTFLKEVANENLGLTLNFWCADKKSILTFPFQNL